jgi:hypothetical protein
MSASFMFPTHKAYTGKEQYKMQITKSMMAGETIRFLDSFPVKFFKARNNMSENLLIVLPST